MIKLWLAGKMVRRRNNHVFTAEELEKRHFSPKTPGFNNSIYFAGVSGKGLSIVTRMSFRSDKEDENWLKLYLPGVGIIGFENLPLTSGTDFRQGKLHYECITPGRIWRIYYEGFIDERFPGQSIKIELTWSSEKPILDFSREGVSFENTAKQISRSAWSPTFFKQLRGLGKVHYEQGGTLTGTVEFNGRTYRVDAAGIRDHSYGTRSWIDWDRHLWLVGILEGGLLFNISAIDYNFIKNLKAGFIEERNRINTTLFSSPGIEDIVGQPALPENLNFNIQKTRDGGSVAVTVNMKHFFPFLMDGVYHIRQAAAEFEIGGKKGMGIAEMGINIIRYPDVV